jgi:hypothetical protein
MEAARKRNRARVKSSQRPHAVGLKITDVELEKLRALSDARNLSFSSIAHEIFVAGLANFEAQTAKSLVA